MIHVQRPKRASALIFAFSLILLLAGCSPLYTWDTHITPTPRPESLTVAELSRAPLATLGPITPAGFKGFSAFLSRGLIAAISEASSSIRGIPTYETLNMINAQGLSGRVYRVNLGLRSERDSGA
jgi:hypothetical protein